MEHFAFTKSYFLTAMNTSPLTYAWSVDDVIALIGAPEHTTPLVRASWEATAEQRTPFLNTFCFLYCNSGGIAYGSRITVLCLQFLQATIAQYDKSEFDGQEEAPTLDDFLSGAYGLISVLGPGVITSDVHFGMEQVKQQLPQFASQLNAVALVDVGAIFRLMQDYVALKTLEI